MNSNNEIVKNYFKDNFPSFEIICETSHGPHWVIIFNNKGLKIYISGDIGFEIKITTENSKFDLWEYDRSVNNVMKTTNENILYQLDVLKRFLSESTY